MERIKSKWDVSDIDPVTMFPKDCRFYNGGLVATEKERQLWIENEERYCLH